MTKCGKWVISLVFFIIAITPWIIFLFKPSEIKSIHQVAISTIAFIGLIIHTIDPQLLVDSVTISLVIISILPWIVPYLGSANEMTSIKVGISLFAFSIIVLHFLWPRSTIDTAIISLVMISIFPWIMPYLKSLELPLIGKFEFNNKLKEVAQKAEEAGLLYAKTDPHTDLRTKYFFSYGKADSLSKDKSKTEYSFQQIAETDPNLALAGLRIEIEYRLRAIAESRDLELRNSSDVDVVLDLLYLEKILSREEKSAIFELINLLNKAVHCAEVNKSSAYLAIKTCQDVLNALDNKSINPRLSIEFVRIPAGKLIMGFTNDEDRNDNEIPAHKITIRNSFDIGRYPVTQEQWTAIMGYNHSYLKGNDHPVVNVSWNEIQEFIKKLNEMEGIDKYRLPSEAEWEYACRAGTTTKYSFGDDESKLKDYAWYVENSGDKIHSVGQKKPNPWGLYDMHGNMWEWVQDKYHPNYDGAPSDGSAWEDRERLYRVARGGCWKSSYSECRSTYRSWNDPGISSYIFGFRILRSVNLSIETNEKRDTGIRDGA
jgi:formylglycine-generating enzyme required for sulfatase activity